MKSLTIRLRGEAMPDLERLKAAMPPHPLAREYTRSDVIQYALSYAARMHRRAEKAGVAPDSLSGGVSESD